MPCRGPDYYEDGSNQIKNLKSTVDKLTKILCDISNSQPTDSFSKILYDNPDLRIFLKQHLEDDQNRWFEYYKLKYKAFSKEEIIKMIEQGILPKI